MIEIGGKTLPCTFLKYKKVGGQSFSIPKKGLFRFNVSRTHFKRLILGWLKNTIGTIENMIDLGDKRLSEFFVKYEKSGCRPFLLPKSAIFRFLLDTL